MVNDNKHKRYILVALFGLALIFQMLAIIVDMRDLSSYNDYFSNIALGLLTSGIVFYVTSIKGSIVLTIHKNIESLLQRRPISIVSPTRSPVPKEFFWKLYEGAEQVHILGITLDNFLKDVLDANDIKNINHSEHMLNILRKHNVDVIAVFLSPNTQFIKERKDKGDNPHKDIEENIQNLRELTITINNDVERRIKGKILIRVCMKMPSKKTSNISFSIFHVKSNNGEVMYLGPMIPAIDGINTRADAGPQVELRRIHNSESTEERSLEAEETKTLMYQAANVFNAINNDEATQTLFSWDNGTATFDEDVANSIMNGDTTI